MEIDRTEITRLRYSSPETVFEWLKDNKPERDGTLFDSFYREGLEEALLERDCKLINLGLALYGYCAETGQRLFDSENIDIKEAVTAGTTIQDGFDGGWIKNSGTLEGLLEDAKANEVFLKPLFANPYIRDSLLVCLFEKSEVFKNTPDEDWMKLVYYSSKNERLSTPYKETYLDGYLDYSYHKVFTSAWGLLDKLEPTKNNARILCDLTTRLLPRSFSDLDLPKLLDKWADQQNKEDQPKYGVNVFQLLRQNIGKLIGIHSTEFAELKLSADQALRYSYYSRYLPKSTDEMWVDFEKDIELYADAALNNEQIFRNVALRETFSDICWKVPDEYHDMLYPNIFRSRINDYENKYPEWFKDDDIETVFEDEDLIHDQMQVQHHTHADDKTFVTWQNKLMWFVLGMLVMFFIEI